MSAPEIPATARPPPPRVFVPLIHRQTLERARAQIAGRRRLYPALAAQHVAPPYHALNLLKVIWALLGFGPAQLGDAAAERAERRAFSWAAARATFSDAFVQQLVAYDPERDDGPGAEERKPPAQRVERLKVVLETMLEREVTDLGPAFTPLLAWARAAVAIRDTCLEQRERARLLMAQGLL